MGLRFVAAADAPRFSPTALTGAAQRVREGCTVVEGEDGGVGVGFDGSFSTSAGLNVLGSLPPVFPEHLGDRSFTEVHGCRFPYVRIGKIGPLLGPGPAERPAHPHGEAH